MEAKAIERAVEQAVDLAFKRYLQTFAELEVLQILPTDPKKRKQLSDAAWIVLRDVFVVKNRLSDYDVKAWWAVPPHISASDLRAINLYQPGLEIMHAFDVYLIEQFEKFGSRLNICKTVENRVLEWERRDIPMLRRYTAALLNYAEGNAKVTGDQFLEIREKLLPELVVFFNKVRNDLREPNDTIADMMALYVKHLPNSPNLSIHFQAVKFEAAVRNYGDPLFVQKIRNRQIKAEGFLNRLVAKGKALRHLKRLKAVAVARRAAP